MQSSFLVHPIPPLYDKDSRILILGSFPSPKSREARFFYGHPQNRFWKVMAQVLDWRGEDSRGLPGSSEGGDPPTAGGPVFVPSTVEEKRIMLLSNHIRTCVRNDIRDGNDEVVEELVATLQKMMK